MTPHSVNKLDNFIKGWILDDTSICDSLIRFHQQSKNKKPGMTGGGIDKEYKDSIDVVAEDPVASEYILDCLYPVLKKYIDVYKWSGGYGEFEITQPFNIQHYPKGGGFKSWHTERGSARAPDVSRHLVFMTYLNDVNDCGETEWYYQKMKIAPRKGLTVVWPADWTFTHRGIPSDSEEKWIATGWLNFVER